MRRKTTFANIHVKNMTHVTELELNTRAFAPPFVHIPFIPVGRTKECQECAKISLQVGYSAVRFKNVPLTTESKISLRSRSCSPATSSNQWLGSAGARLLRDARHKRHRSLHGSTCRMDSNATKARSTLRRVAERLLILANEGQ